MGRCVCSLLPCICVETADDYIEDLPPVANNSNRTNNHTDDQSKREAKSKLRSLFAANATTQCMSCMMLPCICPAEDEITLGEDETTSVEAASPVGSDLYGADRVDGDEEAMEMDAYGRVRIIATGSSESADDTAELWVAKEIKRSLKPHQIDGVKFLSSHIQANRGCILADYMGLGKTLQVITVIYSFMIDELAKREQSDSSGDDTNARTSPVTTMVLCPAICIPNWESEFKKWLSPESLQRCPLFTLDSSTSKATTAARVRVLERWKREGGVLLMGYEMFRSLLNPTLTTSLDRDASIQVCTRVATSTMEITNSVSTKTQKSAREFYRLLCNPGADLVVLDEGHRMKDPTSLLCQSVAKIHSKRRLVLTGYPVQNSLSEYWCMVNFARENFLGSYDEFRSHYEKPIMEGNTSRSTELITKLQDMVLRRGKALLNKQLPPKREWILYCKLSPIQHRLYCDFLNFYGESDEDGGKATADLLTAYAALLQVMNHPDIIHSKLCPQEGEDFDEDDVELALSNGNVNNGWAWESEERLMEKKQLAVEQQRKRRQKFSDRQKSFEWARPVVFGDGNTPSQKGSATLQMREDPEGGVRYDFSAPYRTEVLENSGKMAVLMRIVEESFACGDKVVVFSQSVPTLKVIADFLRASSFSPTNPSENTQTKAPPANKFKRRKLVARPRRDPAGILRKRQGSTKEKHGSKGGGVAVTTLAVSSDEWFLQIDGSTPGPKRMEYIECFSSPTSAVKLLLVSTRAGAEGINLHAANRLVLFDVSWNPSNDHQSMCRSHRIGQFKTVHVYRLVSTGTMERMIYEQQMKKVDLSTTVVDSHDVSQKGSASGSDATTTGDHTSTAPASATEETEAARFSGFLQPPSEPDTLKPICVEESLIADDDVLVSCVQNSGHWLVDIHPVHDISQEDQ